MCTTQSNTHYLLHITFTCSILLPRLLFRLSPEERAHVEAQLDELTATYNELCDSSTQQLQQLEQQLAKEEKRKVFWLEGWAEMEKGYFRFMTTCILLMLSWI